MPFVQVILNDWRLILTKNIKNAAITDREINPNNRTHIVKFRVTEKEKLELELCCKRLNISMSTLIRQSLLGKPVQHTVLVAGGGEDALSILSDLLGQCGKIGGNLNQLSRHHFGSRLTIHIISGGYLLFSNLPNIFFE